MKTGMISVLVAILGCLLSGGMAAAADAAIDAGALAKAAQNPLATMATLPLQANYNAGVGAYDRTAFNLNIQPVIPYTGENWNLITRTILPLNSVPLGETDAAFGLGDASMSFFFSPARAGAVTWGVGPIVGLPTASNPELLGSGKWGAGPTGILFAQLGKWTMGGLVSNIWSFAGDGDREDYNLLTAQYFLNYNFGGGWAIGSAPIINANWKAESGDQWTIPWGLQISKVSRINNQAINLLVGYYSNSQYPEGGAQSQTRFQINFMFPKPSK